MVSMDDKMRIAIIDDQPTDLEYIDALVSLWAKERAETVVSVPFPSAEAFLFAYSEDQDFDILLLDVEMTGEDGITLAKRLRLEGCSAEIVFVTSHFELAGEGYEVDALHWLVKPVSREKFSAVLTKASERLSAAPPSVVVSSEGETIRLMEREILYAEAFLHYLVIHTDDREVRIKDNMGGFAGRLSEDFFRVHRSVLVNLRRIVKITRTDVTLDSGDVLPVARGKYDDVNRAFIEKVK